MGQLTLDRVVVALNESGIRAERAYPMGKMLEITDIAATVCLQKASVRDRNLTVLVTVFAPLSVGASACEEAALMAGDVLRFHGGKASVGDCRFDGRTGLFSAEVTGVFADGLEIVLDGAALAHAVSSGWRSFFPGEQRRKRPAGSPLRWFAMAGKAMRIAVGFLRSGLRKWQEPDRSGKLWSADERRYR